MESPEPASGLLAGYRGSFVILLHGFLLASLVALGLLKQSLSLNADDCLYPVSLLLFATVLWCVLSWRLMGHALLSAYMLFFLSAALFNGAQCALEVFRLNQNGMLDGQFSSETLVETTYLVCLGMAFFHCGALSGAAGRERESGTATGAEREKAVRAAGYIFVAISFIPACLVMSQDVSVVMTTGYTGLFGRDMAVGFKAAPRILSSLLVPGALYVLAGSRGRSKTIGLLVLLVLSVSAVYLFMGARGGAAMAVTAFLWLYHQRIRRLNRSVLIAVAAAFLVLFPVIAIIRTTAGEWRLSLDEVARQVEQSNAPLPVAALSEMGRSMSTVAYTLDLVPAVRAFDYGLSYAYGLLGVVPNLGWDVHPAMAHSFLADWLIRTVDPGTAARGGGLGFSFIAEAYLNFGWSGAPLALAFIGWALSRFFRWAESSADPARKAVLASFLSFFLLYARGESASFVRALAWYAFLPYLVVCLLSWRGDVQARRRNARGHAWMRAVTLAPALCARRPA